jgi:Zn-dependent protease
MDQLVVGLLWYIAFLFSITLHEASHAFAAFKLGDRTAYEGGQVTLDPIPHIRREPIGTVVVPIISFLIGGWIIGWASAPYDAKWAYDNPKSSAKMAAAGPASNLLLAILAALIIRIGILADIFAPPDSINFTHIIESTQEGALETVATFINVFFSLNLLLFIFNLIPVPPLDGSGIIPWFLGHEKAQRYIYTVHSGGFSIIGLFIAWNVFNHIYDPIHLFFVNVLYHPIAYYQ